MNPTTFSWDSVMALVGPATHSINIGSGATAGTIAFVSGAHTTCTREILVGGTSDGNIKVTFLNDTATSVTIPVKSGQRYAWAVTKVWRLATGGVTGIWGFY